jgi:hypothetical protein
VTVAPFVIAAVILPSDARIPIHYGLGVGRDLGRDEEHRGP